MGKGWCPLRVMQSNITHIWLLKLYIIQQHIYRQLKRKIIPHVTSLATSLILTSKIILLQVVKTHYRDVIIIAMASQITTIVYSTVYSGADQRKHQSSASLAFVRGIHRWHKGSETRKMFPFDNVNMPTIDVYHNFKVTSYSECERSLHLTNFQWKKDYFNYG